MHFASLSAVALLAMASSAYAGSASVTNRCKQDLWVSITRAGPGETAHTFKLPTGRTWSESYQGTGNSIGVTTNPNYYSPDTAKLIWGYSDQPPMVYWSVNSVNGNIGLPFSVVAGDDCPGTNGFNGGKTLTCSDKENISLYVC
ncbi:hypothetical protein NA57DRAFT_60450 [Rhizodiscina lignyota]|uniref:Uncharacterized protein n=1 Tax=Rhizodiscina lignyota TaxID=1504668 RepID=A0A9P4M197_9PEZI|nr:hypothetical protein NA57DRAFT_60450 [Rhizodiscina lignyota]